MQTTPTSPKITSIGWGTVQVEGVAQLYKDAKLYPGGSRAWDWSETGTKHSPGIQPADVHELLDHGAEVVVLATGVFGRLGVCQETRNLLQERKVQVHVLKTREAVPLYNQLREKKQVGALIHSTC